MGTGTDNTFSGDAAGSWCLVDVGPGRRMLPNRYAWRGSGSNEQRNWNLEGRRHEFDAWTILRQHEDDTTGQASSTVTCWSVETSDAGLGFRFLRIVSTCVGSQATQYLGCNGREIWGTLIDTTPPERAASSSRVRL